MARAPSNPHFTLDQRDRVLEELRTFSTARRDDLQIDGDPAEFDNVAADLRATRSVVVLFREYSADLALRVVHMALLERPLTNGVRAAITATVPELVLDQAAVREHYFAKGLDAADSIAAVAEGTFLRETFQHGRSFIQDTITVEAGNTLLDLEKKVGTAVGKKYRFVVPLLFHALRGDLHTLQRIIHAHIEVFEHTGRQPEPPHFFSHVVHFFEVYNAVTSFLISNVRQKDVIELNSREWLYLIFQDPRVFAVGAGGDFMNLFDVLIESFSSSQENPWFYGDLEPTPFDADKIRHLISSDILPAVLAQVFLRLNDYLHLDFMKRIRAAILEYKRSKSERRDTTQAEAELDECLHAADLPCNGAPIADRLRFLERFLEQNGIQVKSALPFERNLADAAPLFFRLLDPRKIVTSPEAQGRFLELWTTMKKDADRPKNDPVLGDSLRMALHTRDPFLDVPLIGSRHRTLRSLLMELVFLHFDDAIIERGFREGDRPLICMADAERLAATNGDLRKNFNTAGVGIERKLLTDAADVMVDTYPFEKLLGMAQHAVAEYVHAPRGSMVCFYGTATEAMRDLMQQCFSDLKRGHHAVVTNHEYDSITDRFKKRRQKKVISSGVRVVFLNKRSEGRVKTVDELFADFAAQIDVGKTRMIIISSKTRFGDAPCSTPGKKNLMPLADLIVRLKSAYPGIPVMVDGCQALGRGNADFLSELKADLYLTSGAKALGTDFGGCLVLSEDFLQKYPSFHYEPSYLPMKRITAMGLAVKMLGSTDDLCDMKGNLGTLRRHRLDHKVAYHLSRLQSHALMRAQRYAQEFVTEQLIDAAPSFVEGKSGEGLEEQFACDVNYPVHRNPSDYVGIMTISFPNVNGSTLVRGLKKLGYKLLYCLHKHNRGVRISFHYFHTTADIDALFEDIKKVHGEVLRRKITTGEPLRHVPLSTWAEN